MIFLMLILGVLSLYVSLTGILNETRIVVQDGKINITSQLLPWRRDRPQEISNVVKINNIERFARWKFEPPRVYPIIALTGDGNTRTVLSHTYSELEATYICEQLQRSLRLDCKPYYEVLLDKLYAPAEESNPYFDESRQYTIDPHEINRIIQTMLRDSNLIYRQNLVNLPFTFDVLDRQMGSGEFYMLTQVTIKAHASGSEVTIKQKPKPYINGTIGHSLNVRRFFGKVESAIKASLEDQ